MATADFPGYRRHLNGLIKEFGTSVPGVMAGFAKLHLSACAEGTLPAKTKELIALGIGVAARCEGCIAFHVHDAIRAGATDEEITETIGVAVMMGGGPALMYGAEAIEALGQFRRETSS